MTEFFATVLDEPLCSVLVDRLDLDRGRVSNFGPVLVQPGDVVRLQGSTIVEVLEPAQAFWLTACWPEGTAVADVRAAGFRWAEEGQRTFRSAALTVEIQTTDRRWMHKLAGQVPELGLDYVEVRRTPVDAFDLAFELERERLGV